MDMTQQQRGGGYASPTVLGLQAGMDLLLLSSPGDLLLCLDFSAWRRCHPLPHAQAQAASASGMVIKQHILQRLWDRQRACSSHHTCSICFSADVDLALVRGAIAQPLRR